MVETLWKHARIRGRSRSGGRASFKRQFLLSSGSLVVLYQVQGGKSGSEKLREYLNAPAHVQDQFDKRIKAQVEAEQDAERYFAAADSDDDVAPEQPESKMSTRPVRWDESWTRRAQITALGGKRFDRYETMAQQREALVSIPPADYVAALTGEEVEPNRPAHCPLPDHDERTGSFYVYDDERGWYCYGCGKGGTIYDFASALWLLPTRGAGFVAIHKRLLADLGVDEQVAA